MYLCSSVDDDVWLAPSANPGPLIYKVEFTAIICAELRPESGECEMPSYSQGETAKPEMSLGSGLRLNGCWRWGRNTGERGSREPGLCQQASMEDSDRSRTALCDRGRI